MTLSVSAQRERVSSRAVEPRLDEPRQVIPQHGCVPAEPVSVSLGDGKTDVSHAVRKREGGYQ
jgi:hypothetical protein